MVRVAVVLTARPSFARVKTVLEECGKHPNIELVVVPAASAAIDRTGRVMAELRDYSTTHPATSVLEGDSLLHSVKGTGLLTMELGVLFHQLAPDVVVTIADRHETMATAIAATYQNIPLAHIQGGEISGNIDNRVRHSITMMSDIHFPATAGAATLLHAMGISKHRIHHVGCPSVDLARRSQGVPSAIKPWRDPYVVVINHSETQDPGASYTQMREILAGVEGLPTLVIAPGVDAGSMGTRQAIREKNIEPIERLTPEDTYRLIKGAICLVGNSSLGIREAGAIGVWAINCGVRQRGRERGPNVVDVTYNTTEIKQAIERVQEAPKPPKSILYGTGDAGEKIAAVLGSLKEEE